MDIQTFYILTAVYVAAGLVMLALGFLAGTILARPRSREAAVSRDTHTSTSTFPKEAASVGSETASTFTEREVEQMTAARKAFEAEQKAFTQMLHYNVNDVYGSPGLDEIKRRSKGEDS